MIFYIDRNQTINCSLSVQGGEINSNVTLRLNLKTKDCNLFFEGEKLENQDWKIFIPSLSKLDVGAGDVNIEVVVDGYYFSVYSEQIEIKRLVPLVDFKIGDVPKTQSNINPVSIERPNIKLDIKYDEPVIINQGIVEKEEVKKTEVILEKEEVKKRSLKNKTKQSGVLEYEDFVKLNKQI